MYIKVHSGSVESVGTFIELSTRNSRILLGAGIPLKVAETEKIDTGILIGKSAADLVGVGVLPDIPELYSTGKGINGLLISHYNPEHYVLLQYISPQIPIYLCPGAKELIDISGIFISSGPSAIRKTGSINYKVIKKTYPFKIGDFNVRPFEIDQSAYDALAYLVEAEGKKVFYPGNLSAYGNKSYLYRMMPENPPENIDCMFMEGIYSAGGKPVYESEKDVEQGIINVLEKAENITFLFLAEHNIDRIVGAYKACRKTDSILVIDLYSAFVLEKMKKVYPAIPQLNWKNIRIKYWKNHADRLTAAGYSGLIYEFNKKKIDMYEINRNKKRVLMTASDDNTLKSILKEIEGADGATVIFSKDEVFLTEEFIRKSATRNLKIEKIHAAGYASIEDMQKFVQVVNPKKIVPLYKEFKEKYGLHFDNIEFHGNQETWNV